MPRLLRLAGLMAACAALLLSLPRTVQRAAFTQPVLTVLRAPFTLGCGFDGSVSAPQVCERGRVLGVYIDDTTPDLNRWLALAVSKYPLNLRAVGMGQAHARPRDCRWAHVLCLVEWYPFCSGYPVREWGAFPRHIGVILQDRFPGFTGRCHPTRRQVRGLIARALRRGDKPILLY